MSSDKRIPRWQKVFLIGLFGFLPVYYGFVGVQRLFSGSFHDGPSHLVTLGLVRFQSCSYQGSFVGGAGYDCVVKNVTAADPRDVGNTHCAGFDGSNRMVGGPLLANNLYGQVMGPGEERVIRMYLPENAVSAICSETGDIIPPAQLQTMMSDLRKANLVEEIQI